MDKNLDNFLDFTSNDNRTSNSPVKIEDQPEKRGGVSIFDDINKKPKISEDEFSKRYDKLSSLLNSENQQSNLVLKTPTEKQAFKLFKNASNSLELLIVKEESKISISKSRLVDMVYYNKVYQHHRSYINVVIEKLLDNSIFDYITVDVIDDKSMNELIIELSSYKIFSK